MVRNLERDNSPGLILCIVRVHNFGGNERDSKLDGLGQDFCIFEIVFFFFFSSKISNSGVGDVAAESNKLMTLEVA